MKPMMVGVLLLTAGSASAQTVNSTTATITIKGSGFQSGATVTQNGVKCVVVSNKPTQIVTTCPSSGTIVVTNPSGTTYPYALLALNAQGTQAITSLAFAWTVGSAAPVVQTYLQADTSVCPPPTGVPYCAWPNTTVTSDSPWLTVSPSSGTTAFTITVSINTAGLTSSPPTGHIIVTQPLFTTPTLSIPVTLVVTGGGPKVSLNWPASTVPAGGGPVTGYNILRGTASTGPFTQIATTADVLTYVDATPPTGTACYTVQGVNSSGPSVDSTVTCVTVPASAAVKLTRARTVGWGLILATLGGIIALLRKRIMGMFATLRHSKKA